MSSKVNKATHALLEQIDAPIMSFFTSCVHCGMCADACLFYTETGDPKYTPIYKVLPMRRVWQQEFTFMGRLLKTLGLNKKVTEQDLAEWEELVYDSCTLCGRCSLVCPVGNDITYMIRKFREGMVAAGYAPKGLKGAMQRAIEIGSPMGVTLQTLQAQIKHAEKETGLTIPLDQEGADYMMLLSSAEIAEFAEIIPAVAQIFHHAGVSWTLCSTAFEATNTGIQIGSSDLAAELVERIVAGAQRLKVKTVITPECGHAYVALRWEGANLIGRPLPFSMTPVSSFVAAGGSIRRATCSNSLPVTLLKCRNTECTTGAAAVAAASAPMNVQMIYATRPSTARKNNWMRSALPPS